MMPIRKRSCEPENSRMRWWQCRRALCSSSRQRARCLAVAVILVGGVAIGVRFAAGELARLGIARGRAPWRCRRIGSKGGVPTQSQRCRVNSSTQLGCRLCGARVATSKRVAREMENEAPPALAADDAAPPAAKRRRWDTGATPAPAGAAPAAVDPTIAASAAQAAAMAAAAAAAAAAATALSATAAGAAAVLPSVLGAGVLQAKEAARAALEKAQQGTMGGIAPSIAAAAQAQAAAAAAAATQGGVRPAVVTIDNQGRLLDEHGKVIQSSSRPQTTFKVNEQARKNVLLEEAPPPDVSASKYYDPRMQIPGQSRDNRKKRAFSFVAEGHFTRKAEDMRAKAAMELMLQNASQPASKRAAAAAALLAAQREETGRRRRRVGRGGAVGVTLERRLAEVLGGWWICPAERNCVPGPPGDSVEANAVLDGISHLIEHPVPIAPPAEPPPPPPMPMPLTGASARSCGRSAVWPRRRRSRIRSGAA